MYRGKAESFQMGGSECNLQRSLQCWNLWIFIGCSRQFLYCNSIQSISAVTWELSLQGDLSLQGILSRQEDLSLQGLYYIYPLVLY